jgi:DNA-binding MarR family transcriptional regulator
MSETSIAPDLEGIRDRFELEEEETVEGKYEELLKFVQSGRNRTDELADGLGLSGVETEYLIREGEKNGDVVRDGYTGKKLYTIRITSQGESKLPEISETDAKLAEYNLTELDYKVLKIIADVGPCTIQPILKEFSIDIPPIKVIPVLNHLVRENYCESSGLWRRYVEITDRGQSVIEIVEREVFTKESEHD